MARKNYSKIYKEKENEVTPVEEVQIMTSQVKEIVENNEGIEVNEVVEVTNLVKGVISGCRKLYVRKKPNKGSVHLCILDAGTEVTVNTAESTEDFYKVCTAAGIEGYCMKKFMSIK